MHRSKQAQVNTAMSKHAPFLCHQTQAGQLIIHTLRIHHLCCHTYKIDVKDHTIYSRAHAARQTQGLSSRTCVMGRKDHELMFNRMSPAAQHLSGSNMSHSLHPWPMPQHSPQSGTSKSFTRRLARLTGSILPPPLCCLVPLSHQPHAQAQNPPCW